MEIFRFFIAKQKPNQLIKKTKKNAYANNK